MVLEIYMRPAVQRYRDKTVDHETSLYSPPGVKLNPVDLDGWRERSLEGCGRVTDDELVEDFKEVKDGDTIAAFQAVASRLPCSASAGGEKRAPSVFETAHKKDMNQSANYGVYLSCKTSSFDCSESASRSTRTLAIPDATRPRILAAARDTSMMRPLPNGPRSLIRTSTDFPLVRLVTFTLLPHGRVR